MNSTHYEDNMPLGTGKFKIAQNISNAIILSKNENYKREEITLENKLLEYNTRL